MNKKNRKGMSSSMILPKEIVVSLLSNGTHFINPKGRTVQHNA